MANQLKNMLIGLFVIIAAFLIIGIILFIKPSVGDGKQVIKVRFSNINGINIGTPVTYAGKTIGEVADIAQVTSAREQAVNQFGQVYPYLLTLHVDSNYTIFTTDEITVQTQGLLGEKYVAIIPKHLKVGQVTHIITSKDLIYADANDLLESAMNEISLLSQKIEEALNVVIAWVHKYGDTLGSAIHSLDVTISEAGKTLKDFNELDIIHDVKNATKNFANTFSQIDESLTELKNKAFFGNMANIVANTSSITTDIKNGKGTLGKIITDDGLYLQVNALMTKANTLITDINQYGLLFHYNHEWQRGRVKLMRESNQIKDAKAFQFYMDTQINQINTTLERMSLLTNRLSTEQLADNPRFKKKFAELMNQLNGIQENIKLYNQELFDIQSKDSCE
ncbi:MAG: MCE family protein [Chlamydiae bacterium]|nr:MCE family protein [Chlamydiota bacterium]